MKDTSLLKALEYILIFCSCATNTHIRKLEIDFSSKTIKIENVITKRAVADTLHIDETVEALEK